MFSGNIEKDVHQIDAKKLLCLCIEFEYIGKFTVINVSSKREREKENEIGRETGRNIVRLNQIKIDEVKKRWRRRKRKRI